MADNIQRLEKTVFGNFTPFIDCISETNNKEVNNPKDLDLVIFLEHN